MVQVIPGNRLRNLVGIVIRLHAVDLKHPCTCQTLPVELDGVKVTCVRGSQLVDEVDRIGGYINILMAVDFKIDKRSRKNALKGGITIREPAYTVAYQKV